MRRLFVPCLVALGWVAVSAASTDRERAATDQAQEARAAGRPGEAARVLTAALASVDDPAGQSRLRCQLGATLLADGNPSRALEVLAEVPRESACGPRAAWLRVDALEALGRGVEAAALAEELGSLAAGEDRDGVSAEALAGMARRLVSDPDRGLAEGLGLYELALGLQISGERRAALAQETYRAQPATVPLEALCDALTAQLATAEDPAVRLQAVDVCGRAWTLLVGGVPDGADREWAVAAHVDDPLARAMARDRAWALRPDPARLSTLADAWSAADALEARRSWLALDTADSVRSALMMNARAGRWQDLNDEAETWLERWGTEARRFEVTTLQATALLTLARSARGDAARAWYDALITQHPTAPQSATASWEAGLLAHAAGRPDEARLRWETTRATWPESQAAADALQSLVRQVAFDDGKPELALGMLRAALASAGASEELTRLREPGLSLSSGGAVRGDPTVHLVTRNVDRVELRVHHIDPLAWARAGHSLLDLETMDVAAIAPDRSWTVQVPNPTPMVDRSFDVAAKVPGPGLYAVTAASSTEEARALVLVSDLRVVSRTVGRDTAVAVFDDRGRPVPGARVWLVDDEVVEGRTDDTGLFVARDLDLDPAVLVEKGGNWALVPASGEHVAPEWEPRRTATSELDRSVYLPGDRVGVRVVARTGVEPVTGAWTVWLERGGLALAPVTVDADGRGAVHTELELPADAPEWGGPHPRREEWTVRGLAPGESVPRLLGTFQVAAQDSTAFSFWTVREGDSLVVHVRDPDDLPATNVPVVVDGSVTTTDATGTARVRGPGRHLPWTPRVSLPGTDAAKHMLQAEPPGQPVNLSIAESTLRPSESPVLTLHGRGVVHLAVFRLVEPEAPPAGPVDPWVPVVDPTLRGWHREVGTGVPVFDGLRESVVTQDVTLDGDLALPLSPLPAGRYEVVAATADGRGVARAGLRVDPAALRVTGVRDVGAGDVLRLVPDGGVALVTAEGAGLLWAGVRAAGRPAVIEVDGAWNGPVVLSATGADGQHDVRLVAADPNPVLTVVAERAGERFVARATVVDRAGRPVDAEVSFTAWDPRVEASEHTPPALSPDFGVPSGEVATTFGDGGSLSDGGFGEPIAPALLAENQLRRERELARAADRTGGLSDNALAEMMLGEVPMEFGGSTGSGYGMGGGSMGAGGIGMVGGTPIVLGADDAPLPGIRERVLWEVVPTVDGAVEVAFSAPPARLRLRATALTRYGLTSGTIELDADDALRMSVRRAAPGSVEDRARPVVTVVNGADAPVAAELSIGGESVALTLGPNEARRVVATREVAAAERAPITLSGGGGVLRDSFVLPLAEGAPGESGPVTLAAAGPGALAAVVTRGGIDPRWTPEQWADAGRAAVAAWRVEPDDGLARWIRQVRGHLRTTNGASPAATASFLLESEAAGIAAVSEPELTAALDLVVAEGSVLERLRAACALEQGGRPISADTEASLRTEATEPDERRWLGQLLRLRGTADAPATVAPLAPPLPGDPWLVDWVLAAASAPRREARVAGQVLPNREVAAFVGEVRIDGPAFVWHGSGVEGGSEDLLLSRIPAGPGGVAVPNRASGAIAGSCEPCRLRLDDGLYDPDRLLGSTDATIRVPFGGALWRARLPGRFLLGGIVTPVGRVRAVQVVVDDDAPPTPSAAWVAMTTASDWHAARVRVELPTGSRELPAGRLAGLVLDDALLADDDAKISASFRSLVAATPASRLPMDEAVRVARALRASGDVGRSAALWREIADQSFLDEVAILTRMEPQVGVLAAIQRTREASLRYPLGRAVGEVSYLLPGRLLALVDGGLPPGAAAAGITPTDVRLTAAAWDREFLATFPDHERAPAAGLRLGRTLLQLHAPDTAAGWARRVRQAHDDDPLVDALLFLEAVSLTEAGEASAAEPLLRSLAEGLFPNGGGPPVPSTHAGDAALALARLDESRGRFDAAVARYRDLDAPEAQAALEGLTARRMEVPALVVLAPGERAVLPIEVEGVDQVSVRAYRVDLRTLFLRDGGLLGVRDLAVDGVSPIWTDERSLGAGPFPEVHPISLPLTGSGAWLVQLDGEGTRGSSLVVRSDLVLHLEEQGRVEVRRGGRPAVGVEVRALSNGRVVPVVTDVRGVATVPPGAAVLAWSGDAVAFTAPDSAPAASSSSYGELPTSTSIEGVEGRLRSEQAADDSDWQQLGRSGGAGVRLP